MPDALIFFLSLCVWTHLQQFTANKVLNIILKQNLHVKTRKLVTKSLQVLYWLLIGFKGGTSFLHRSI